MSGTYLQDQIEKTKDYIGEFEMEELLVLEDLPNLSALTQEGDMIALACEFVTNPAIQRAINEAFMSLVRSNYWDQLHRGYFPDHKGAETLLSLINLAQTKSRYDLRDFDLLESFVHTSYEQTD